MDKNEYNIGEVYVVKNEASKTGFVTYKVVSKNTLQGSIKVYCRESNHTYTTYPDTLDFIGAKRNKTLEVLYG